MGQDIKGKKRYILEQIGWFHPDSYRADTYDNAMIHCSNVIFYKSTTFYAPTSPNLYCAQLILHSANVHVRCAPSPSAAPAAANTGNK